jgi:hypothetical protein
MNGTASAASAPTERYRSGSENGDRLGDLSTNQSRMIQIPTANMMPIMIASSITLRLAEAPAYG